MSKGKKFEIGIGRDGAIAKACEPINLRSFIRY
jgi:hypothetical protein